MRFALLGNHPDGLALARCLAASGRHQIAVYTSPSLPAELLASWGEQARRVSDLEDVLADPSIEAVIVASRPANRAVHLRRALQSERHVLCVYPPDPSPDLAYEAAMIQNDTGHVLLPLLTEALHPGVARLTELLRSDEVRLGTLQLIEWQLRSTEAVLLAGGIKEHQLSLPGWHVLRVLGGEIAELSALAPHKELAQDESLLLSGRFESGGLFQASLLPKQAESSCRWTVLGAQGQAELLFPLGDPGPAFLTWRDRAGELKEEAWEIHDPWPRFVGLFEAAVARRTDEKKSLLSWQDAVRGLELDDAVRRSVQRRRTSALEYQEANEEVGFKGTMTLAGCGLIWAILLLVILSRWLPWLGWLIAPVLFVFLALQLLRWIIPGKVKEAARSSAGSREADELKR
jgi:predicted dehydrogenase